MNDVKYTERSADMAESILNTLKLHEITPEMLNAKNLMICSGLGVPGKSTRNITVGETCLDSMKEAARNGWIPNVARGLSALQQTPAKAADGTDASAKLITAVVDKIYNESSSIGANPVFYACTASTGACVTKPASETEMKALIYSGAAPTRDMNPNRGVPVDQSGAAMFTFADALMNTDLYLKSEKKETIQERAAMIKKRNTVEGIEAALKLCFMNQPIPEITEDKQKIVCADRALDLAMIMAADGARYKGSEFIGNKKQAKAR